MLCEADGEVVTHEELINRVWSGRALSDNSVAVVIGQLRRALDDDAREPRLIETIPKRGYRLVQQPSLKDRRTGGRHWLLFLTAIALLATVGAAVYLRTSASPREVAVVDVVNLTGDPRNDPLARATSELIVADLSERGFDVRRGEGAGLTIHNKLVMWNGGPSLGMTASEPNGPVVWSSMMNGAPNRVPAEVSKALDDFKRRFRQADPRLAPRDPAR
jgi:hypothetical protein